MNLEQLIEKAQVNYPQLENYLAISLDYTIESLRAIDSSILINFQTNFVPSLEVITALGIYYGEVIVKHYQNAKWLNFVGKDLSQLAIEVSTKNRVTNLYPLVTMNNFWHLKKEMLADSFRKIESMYEGILVAG